MVSAKDSLNDVRVDTLHDYAYLTNAGRAAWCDFGRMPARPLGEQKARIQQ
jgi:hypothetical protein